jgi:hypothetical protein
MFDPHRPLQIPFFLIFQSLGFGPELLGKTRYGRDLSGCNLLCMV